MSFRFKQFSKPKLPRDHFSRRPIFRTTIFPRPIFSDQFSPRPIFPATIFPSTIEYIFLYNLTLNSELFLCIENSYKCLNSKNAIYLSINAYVSLSVASRLCYANELNSN